MQNLDYLDHYTINHIRNIIAYYRIPNTANKSRKQLVSILKDYLFENNIDLENLDVIEKTLMFNDYGVKFTEDAKSYMKKLIRNYFKFFRYASYETTDDVFDELSGLLGSDVISEADTYLTYIGDDKPIIYFNVDNIEDYLINIENYHIIHMITRFMQSILNDIMDNVDYDNDSYVNPSNLEDYIDNSPLNLFFHNIEQALSERREGEIGKRGEEILQPRQEKDISFKFQ